MDRSQSTFSSKATPTQQHSVKNGTIGIRVGGPPLTWLDFSVITLERPRYRHQSISRCKQRRCEFASCQGLVGFLYNPKIMAHAGAVWLQISIALLGILWKLKEGHTLLYIPQLMDISALRPTNLEPHSVIRCLDVLNFMAIKSVASDWPYFALHLFLYLGQLLPLALIALWESLLLGGPLVTFTYVINARP